MNVSDSVADSMARAYWGGSYERLFRTDKQKLHAREAMKRAAGAIPLNMKVLNYGIQAQAVEDNAAEVEAAFSRFPPTA